MPQLINIIGAWVVSTHVGTAWMAWVKLGAVIAANYVASKLFGPRNASAGVNMRQVSSMTRSAIEPRRIVYGQAAVSGPIIYNNVSGTDNEYLWYVIALCDGEIKDYVSIWVDDIEIPKADISWTAGVGGAAGSGTGEVSTATFIGDNSVKALSLYYTLGNAAQVAPSAVDAAFTEWTSNHRCRGVALLTAKLLYNADTETVWQRGAPSNIKAVVKGRKIYDPRLDSTRIIDSTTSPITYGSGVHRLTDDTTWQWSDNPALCVADYLTQYMSVAATSIDWESIANTADDCDVAVNIPPASPSTTETRFTCNGVLTMNTSHKDNLDVLISSCAGRLSYVGGKWKLRASVWEASTVSYDEDDFAGALTVRGSAPKSERFNSVRGVFIDPARDYELAEFPHITNSTYQTRDSRVIEYDAQLPMTNSATMAQRIAFRLLEQANNQIVISAVLNARGAKCAVGDVISLTIDRLSWSAKTFRVNEWSANPDGTFNISAQEDDSASYDDPIVADYIDGNSATITLPSEVVPPPTGFSASSVPYAIRLNWTNPATEEFDYIDVYASDTSAWSGATKIASVRTDTYTHNIGAGTVKYYWIRARRNNGDVSLRTPNSDTSTVTATAGSGTDSVNLAGATLSDQQVVATAEAGYRLTSGGAEQSYEGLPTSPITWDAISTWLLSGSAANFSVRLTKSSGTDPTSGTLNTWQALSSTRTWVWTDSTQDDNAVTFSGTVEIADNTTSPFSVLASASLSVTIDAQTAPVTLSGTSGSPNVVLDVIVSGLATAGWRFNPDGTVEENDRFVYTQFAAATEWLPSGPPSPIPYYIRATNVAESNPTSGTLNTWLSLTTAREWYWQQGVDGLNQGTLKIEIADDTSPIGSNIVATGYYRGRANNI